MPRLIDSGTGYVVYKCKRRLDTEEGSDDRRYFEALIAQWLKQPNVRVEFRSFASGSDETTIVIGEAVSQE